MTATPQAAAQMVSAALRLAGATYSMNSRARGTTIISENWLPAARVNDSASRMIRCQFHNTTSRGAYKVWATAIAVNIAPNAPQAAGPSGCAAHKLLTRSTPGAKQYSTSAI